MFKRLSTVILCTAAVSSRPLTGQVADLTVEQIIQKHIDAQGGPDKINAIETMKATGTASLMGGQIQAPVTVFMKRPNLLRMEMFVQGKTIIQAFDGTTLWRTIPLTGSPAPQQASEEDTQAMQDESDFPGGPLFHYKAKGHSVELVGKEDLDGTPAYRIRVVKKSGNVQFVYLDAQTFLTIRTLGRRRQMGQELDIEEDRGNYKPVNGVMVPFSTEQNSDGHPILQITLEKVQINVPIDESMFRMPAQP